jgi:branched-chain amino acid transport system ATP-binding protein
VSLQLAGATVGYGATIVLRNTSVSVGTGEVVALLGANGAGKTTLLRAASGMLSLRSGDLFLDGDKVTGTKTHRLAANGLCHVTEGRSIFDALTVRQNLRLFCDKAGEAEGQERAIAAFPVLGKRLNQLAGTLSGGEQQMLALSRAYVKRRSVVLLDEISLGLAPIVVDEIFGFLSLLTKEATSLLIVEQYITRALALADRAYILARGSVVFEGPASSVDRDAAFDSYVGGRSRLQEADGQSEGSTR